MNCKAVFGALMPLRPVGASVRNTTCRACSPISPPSSIARAKPTHSFRTARLYTRLSAAEVRRQLIAQKGYTDEALPTVQTITSKLNALGYYPKKVAKSQPQKNPGNRRDLRAGNPDQPRRRCGRRCLAHLDGCQSDRQSLLLRPGREKPYPSRGYRPRLCPGGDGAPVSIFLPTLDELFVYAVTSKVTSDCLVDRLAQWWESVRERFASVTTLVINLS